MGDTILGYIPLLVSTEWIKVGNIVTVGIHSRAVYGGEEKCKCGYVDRWLILTI